MRNRKITSLPNYWPLIIHFQNLTQIRFLLFWACDASDKREQCRTNFWMNFFSSQQKRPRGSIGGDPLFLELTDANTLGSNVEIFMQLSPRKWKSTQLMETNLDCRLYNAIKGKLISTKRKLQSLIFPTRCSLHSIFSAQKRSLSTSTFDSLNQKTAICPTFAKHVIFHAENFSQ